MSTPEERKNMVTNFAKRDFQDFKSCTCLCDTRRKEVKISNLAVITIIFAANEVFRSMTFTPFRSDLLARSVCIAVHIFADFCRVAPNTC